MPSNWYTCAASGLRPCEVLATGPEQAAVDYAIDALRHDLIDEARIDVEVKDFTTFPVKVWRGVRGRVLPPEWRPPDADRRAAQGARWLPLPSGSVLSSLSVADRITVRDLLHRSP